MNVQEKDKIIRLLLNMYPEFSDGSVLEDTEEFVMMRVDLWKEFLDKVSYEDAKENIITHMSHSRELPTISRILGNSKGYVKPTVLIEFNNVSVGVEVVSMNQNQAREILNDISAYFPNFLLGRDEVVKKRVELWAKELIQMDYEKVKKNLTDYKNRSSYPPTIADIRPKVQNTYSIKEQMKEIYGEAYD